MIVNDHSSTRGKEQNQFDFLVVFSCDDLSVTHGSADDGFCPVMPPPPAPKSCNGYSHRHAQTHCPVAVEKGLSKVLMCERAAKILNAGASVPGSSIFFV